MYHFSWLNKHRFDVLMAPSEGGNFQLNKGSHQSKCELSTKMKSAFPVSQPGINTHTVSFINN